MSLQTFNIFLVFKIINNTIWMIAAAEIKFGKSLYSQKAQLIVTERNVVRNWHIKYKKTLIAIVVNQ